MTDLKPAEIGGYTVTKANVVNMREEVIRWRDASFEQWPEAIPFTTGATHLIALLAWVIEIYPEAKKDVS